MQDGGGGWKKRNSWKYRENFWWIQFSGYVDTSRSVVIECIDDVLIGKVLSKVIVFCWMETGGEKRKSYKHGKDFCCMPPFKVCRCFKICVNRIDW